MKTIDLHVHSTYSDGTDTPKELVSLARHCGLSAIALTDHDTVAGLPEFMEACRDAGIEGICGIELSSVYKMTDTVKEFHIVGLFIDPTNTLLTDTLTQLIDSRDNRNAAMAQAFEDIGIHIDLNEMTELYPDAVLTRAHFADYLFRKRFVSSRNEAFDRYLGDGRPCYVRRRTLPAEEAISLIHQAGGLAILAHPLTYHLGSDVLAMAVRDLKRMGLDGMECYYSTFTNRDEADMKELASKNHLLYSGGSDYHGNNKPSISLGIGRGRLEVPYEVLKNLKSSL